MRNQIRKMAAVGAAATLALVLTGSSALAFECYNASRSAQGNVSAAGSNGFFSIPAALMGFCGVAEADVEGILAELEDLGYQTDILINAHALMAGGLEKNGKGGERLHDGKGIDHLGGDFFADVDVVLADFGYGSCS